MTQYCTVSQQCTHCIPMLGFRGGVTLHDVLTVLLLASSFLISKGKIICQKANNSHRESRKFVWRNDMVLCITWVDSYEKKPNRNIELSKTKILQKSLLDL